MRSGTATVSSSTKFYDGGGPNSNYTEDATRVLTIYPATEGKKVSIHFLTVDMEGKDYISIFNGNTNTNENLISHLKTSSDTTITSTAEDGSLTLQLGLDPLASGAGWDADVSLK